MKKILRFLQNNIFPIIITLICVILAWKNYIPNTILSGWDTLHPEFNFWLYFKRAINGVWMEYQGLGAIASQSHSAEITRLLIVGILDLLLPNNLVRYSFFFLCLIVGALGIYSFSKYILSIKWHKYIGISSFLASLFYIFNLTTVQQFYVPLEMFAVHYASVPWLFLLALRYIREKNNRILLLFSIITLFSSSVSHTATLFYAYFVALGLFLIFQNFKKAAVLIFVTVLMNLFWILPNLYFIKNHSAEVSNSKIHRNFTDEAFMQSQSFGDLNNLSLSKNFLFNWREFSFKENDFVDLLDEWKIHLDKPYVKGIGYILFTLSIFGFLTAIYFKSKPAVSLFLPFLLSVFFWINENSPFTNIFIYLRESFPLIKEGLRFPFTKFSIILIMILSIWFGFGSRLLINLLSKIKLGFLFVVIVVVSIFYFQIPQFKGYLISPSMKIQIPDNYFDMSKWLSNQDESARIAKLPLNTYWGWDYNSWGYQGTGFLWFDIKQPILAREFDRWSPYNENFYNEASFAFYTDDKKSFKNILEKYQVRYLLLDESVMNTEGDKKIVEDFGFIKVFNSGFLTIYDTQLATDNFVSVAKYPEIDTSLLKTIDGRTLSTENAIKETFETSHGFSEIYNCDLKKKGQVYREQLINGRKYRAENGGVACDYFVFEGIKYDQTYALHIKGENLAGRSLKIYLYDWETKRVRLEELLPDKVFDEYYVIYPKSKAPASTRDDSTRGGGYTVNIETRSFGRIASENIIETIEFIPFEFEIKPVALQGLTPHTGIRDLQSDLEVKSVKKFGTAIYRVETKGEGILELGQGFEPGWLGFRIEDGRFKKLEHIKVNGWSNGFIVPPTSYFLNPTSVYLVFWPQLLEWGGFVVLIITLISLTHLTKS